MTAVKEIPTYVYRYKVVESTFQKVPVGKILVDTKNVLERTWTIAGPNGIVGEFTGERRERLCGECFAKHVAAQEYGHDGPHGAPRS